MVGLRPHPVSVVLVALLAVVLFSAPPPAAAGGGSGGFLDRAVGPDPAPTDADWILESALDKRKVENDCPDPDQACCTLPGGLDHFANGGAARNTGHTTIRAQSARPGSVAVRATLYIGVIQPNPPPPTIVISFEGHPLVANLLGVSADPCWNGAGVYSLYSVNVLPFIPPWINGDYQIAGIPTARNDGADPWVAINNALPLSEGASLVVIYSHASVPFGSVVYTHTGPSTFIGGALNVNNALAPPLPGGGFLRHTRIGGDGQVGASITANAAVTGDTTAINAIQIKGPGAPANQDSDWNGDDGVPLNQLWDTHTDDVTGTIPAGAGNYVVNYFSPADCVSPSVHVLTAF